MMKMGEGDKFISRTFRVSRPDVSAAKAWLARNRVREPREAVERWLATLGFHGPMAPIQVWRDDPGPELEQAARYLSLRSAGFVAIWELIHSNVLFPVNGHLTTESARVPWTTARPTGSGSNGAWTIDIAEVSYIQQVVSSPVAGTGFTEGDLFLSEIAIPDLHEGVAIALREAATCFRHDLYTPCVAMLGAAAEGAWIVLGQALLPIYAEGSSGQKYGDTIHGQGSVKSKVDVVTKMWSGNPLTAVRTRTGIGTEILNRADEWTDMVRRSRNVLHWGVEATTPNTYDKVATLMLTAPVHLRAIYDARRAAMAFVKEHTSA